MSSETMAHASPIDSPIKRLKSVSTRIPFVGLFLIGLMPGPLKRTFYRLKGAKIGKKVSLGIFTLIDSPDIVLEDGAKISPFTFIRARGKCHLGRRAHIRSFVAIDTGEFSLGADSVIMEQVVVGGMLSPRSSLSIGKRVKVFPYSFLNPTEPIVVEDDVGIGGANYLFTHGSWQSVIDGYPYAFGPITLKRGVWLPWRVFIMPNVTVGEYATIGAGSVITRDIPAHTLAVGSPAKPIKKGEEYLKPMDLPTRFQFLTKTFHEFAELLNYVGWQVQVQSTEGGVRIDSNKNLSVIFLQSAQNYSPNPKELLVSLQTLSSEKRKQCEAVGRGWFDIESKQCALDSHSLNDELRNYLSRYGIRFDVLE